MNLPVVQGRNSNGLLDADQRITGFKGKGVNVEKPE
jgi:hypothetical protein